MLKTYLTEFLSIIKLKTENLTAMRSLSQTSALRCRCLYLDIVDFPDNMVIRFLDFWYIVGEKFTAN